MINLNPQFALTLSTSRIGVIGLGYVGLPLAVALGKLYPTVGFDLKRERIAELERGEDSTNEVSSDELLSAEYLTFSADETALRSCNVYIVAVPTPIDASRQPNLTPLLSASATVGRVIERGDIVIYESTVYPGATEDDCLPVVEEASGLSFNVDFFAGYSPERVSPGDKARPMTKIVKVTSGSTPQAARFVDELYSSIVEAGTFQASSIRVAEASKIIENTQRDVNIALINEISIIFSYLGIDTNEVLDAASTKWNFINLRPGLVGGHCIGVDPYYLVHKSMAVGHIPDIIRTAREINDGMPRNAAARLVRQMILQDLKINGSRALVIGFTFKEDCPDIRNTKSVELVHNLQQFGIDVDIFDPWANAKEVLDEYGLPILSAMPHKRQYEAILVAVPHREVRAMGSEKLRELLVDRGVLFDMKAAFPIDASELRL